MVAGGLQRAICALFSTCAPARKGLAAQTKKKVKNMKGGREHRFKTLPTNGGDARKFHYSTLLLSRVCIYFSMVITFSRLDINRYGCQSCACGQQLNRENGVSLSSFAPDNIVSRGDRFGRLDPRQPAHSFSTLRLNMLLTHTIPTDFHDGVH